MHNDNHFHNRVADAPSGNWVYRALPPALWPYAQLARWDRPIGWQLLMWPCFWSAALAANVAVVSIWHVFFHLVLYFIGAVAMRGAGCTYNDLVDQKIDMQVARTRSRPLPSGRVTRQQAKIFLVLQALTGFIVLLQFNRFTIILALASLGVVALYPFAKRFTDWPQLFLGLAFSWGALVGWSALFGSLSWAAILLYVASVLWTIGYDTIYAHQDKEDDELIGVRSTARLFGDKTRLWLAGLYGLTLVFMTLAFSVAPAGWPAYLGLAVAGAMMAYQIAILDITNGEQCLAVFKSNTKVGLVIFLGLFVSFVVYPQTWTTPLNMDVSGLALDDWDYKTAFRKCDEAIAGHIVWPSSPKRACAAMYMCINEARLSPQQISDLEAARQTVPQCPEF